MVQTDRETLWLPCDSDTRGWTENGSPVPQRIFSLSVLIWKRGKLSEGGRTRGLLELCALEAEGMSWDSSCPFSLGQEEQGSAPGGWFPPVWRQSHSQEHFPPCVLFGRPSPAL